MERYAFYLQRILPCFLPTCLIHTTHDLYPVLTTNAALCTKPSLQHRASKRLEAPQVQSNPTTHSLTHSLTQTRTSKQSKAKQQIKPPTRLKQTIYRSEMPSHY